MDEQYYIDQAQKLISKGWTVSLIALVLHEAAEDRRLETQGKIIEVKEEKKEPEPITPKPVQKATDKQLSLLRRMKIKHDSNISKDDAYNLINERIKKSISK